MNDNKPCDTADRKLPGILKIRGLTEETDRELPTLYKKMVAIAWPAAMEGMLVSLMNSFDTMMVGKLGPAAIASVGLCGQPRMILLLIAQAICMGTTAVVARRRGEEKQEAAVSCLKQSLAIVTVLAVLMTLCGWFLAEPFLRLAGAESDTLPGAVIYFRITCLAFMANFWSLCICAGQRGVGNTRITMTVNMIANGVNVFLNYCLIGGHLGFPALGIKGAAIATAIGTCVSCVAAWFTVLRPGKYLTIPGTGALHFDKGTLSSLFKVGSGTIAESVFLRVGFLINGRLIAKVSTAAYASNQIVTQVTGLAFSLGDGVASACTSLVGQSLGAGKKDRAMGYVKVSRRLGLFMSLTLIVLIFLSRNLLPTFFTDDAEVLVGASVSFVTTIFGLISQFNRVIYTGCLRGAGDVKFTAFVSLVSVAVLRPSLTYLFCFPLAGLFPGFYLEFIGPWLSFDLDAVVRSLLLTHRVNKGKWVNIRL